MTVRGFEANGYRETCKKAVHGQGKGGLSEQEGSGKKGEERRVTATSGGG